MYMHVVKATEYMTRKLKHNLGKNTSKCIEVFMFSSEYNKYKNSDRKTAGNMIF